VDHILQLMFPCLHCWYGCSLPDKVSYSWQTMQCSH